MPGLGLEMKLEGMEALLKKADPAILQEPLRRFWGKALATLEREAKVEAPVDTGRLRSSLTQALDAAPVPAWGAVGTNVKYASYVHMGTAPHEIVPVRTQALRFEVGGQLIFARRVHHPGTKSNPFLSRGLEKSRGAIIGHLGDALREVEQEFNK